MGITPQQLQQMQDRVNGRARAAVPEHLEPPGKLGPGTVVLGVDPSLRGTGFGVIRLDRQGARSLGHGTIRCPSDWDRTRCFAKIGVELRNLLIAHSPAICVIEGLFYAQNLRTALIMGEARGAILLTVAEAGLEIYEMAPRRVKQAIVGYGAAQKTAVAKMVQRMLSLDSLPEPDAADALALALAHVQERRGGGITRPSRL